jgi:hypothetical protein
MENDTVLVADFHGTAGTGRGTDFGSKVADLITLRKGARPLPG